MNSSQPVVIKKLHSLQLEVYTTKPTFEFLELNQTHSLMIHSTEPTSAFCEGDGWICHNLNQFDQPIAIKTADCLPVILWNASEFSFIHLGWKALANQLFKFNQKIFDHYTHAWIGPCIHSCCFEVTEEFTTFFPDSPQHFIKKNNKMYFDLIAECKKQILPSFPKIQLEDSGLCTHCHLEFHSYRRNRTNQRQYNILRRESHE